MRNKLYSHTKQFFNTDVRAITILERYFPNTFSLNSTMLFSIQNDSHWRTQNVRESGHKNVAKTPVDGCDRFDRCHQFSIEE